MMFNLFIFIGMLILLQSIIIFCTKHNIIQKIIAIFLCVSISYIVFDFFRIISQLK